MLVVPSVLPELAVFFICSLLSFSSLFIFSLKELSPFFVVLIY